jgi:hypothetical protein
MNRKTSKTLTSLMELWNLSSLRVKVNLLKEEFLLKRSNNQGLEHSNCLLKVVRQTCLQNLEKLLHLNLMEVSLIKTL